VIRILHHVDRPLVFWFDTDLQQVENLVTKRGLYLFSGPVGSGKTTLMHYIAKQKFSGQQVITIEDPVEIVSPDLLQFQLNEVIGNTYDSLIKLSLRHMPDLVIVGEIRDRETARAVMRASLTGYTVFSTIHAKSISGVDARLLELGVTREEIKNSLSGVVYQRLIAGKVLDSADKAFEKHTNDKWHTKIENWLQMDISHLVRRKRKKLAIKQQVKLMQLMTNLFSSGFHLAEIVDFLARSKLVESKFVTTMREGLSNGKSLSEILNELRFSNSVITQVALADYHGNTQQTLQLITENLTKCRKLDKNW
jgi:type II secretory ATPase GspE/PulE/Tfp pilus assembly ATPase PilB-like protein